MRQLEQILKQIDGRGYSSYKALTGTYNFADYTLYIDYVQSDPFAPPSRVRVRVAQETSRMPRSLLTTRVRRVALADYLTRCFAREAAKANGSSKGTGKSGLIAISRPGQEILERSSMLVNNDFVEARLVVGLPARGRSIMAGEARYIFFEQLPRLVEKSMIYKNLDVRELVQHVEMTEDQEFLRDHLCGVDLVAFIGDGSILPRESGVSDKPLVSGRVIPFKSPDNLRVTIDLPNRGRVTGMGLPAGVSLIVGGGYHGKTTLLRAIERGVYNHVPGDGRELVITVSDAVKIRAEDGRSVKGVDISGFINDLPFGQGTSSFSTANASGSTSQAANIVEALELGATLLLLDEDTSATNFMIRDARMQRLVAKEYEPITPFIDRVRELYRVHGVSSILVIGGSGDYFDEADLVVMMKNYLPRDVSVKARQIAQVLQQNRQVEVQAPFSGVAPRVPMAAGFSRGHRDKVRARGLDIILFGRAQIDLKHMEQLVDPDQTNTIAALLAVLAGKYINDKSTLSQVVEKVQKDMDANSLDILSAFPGEPVGDLARPRKHEIAGAINRYRGLSVKSRLKESGDEALPDGQ